ncbi:MAG: hypothetical protein H7A23_22775 [Leptospiraceae bacterium]|nr:hypothetical protein [Leptospiraceae bacterium]MCP5497389.1 hypothetical protein [Leptospiraceae bacterium]
MRLFIFNFKSFKNSKATSFGKIGRNVLIITVIFFVCWEIFWRHMGFISVHDDNKDLWADKRLQASQIGKESIIIIGSSRVFYGIDTVRLSELTKQPVIQLAINGSSPLPILEDLSQDQNIKGLIICGIVPNFYFNLRTIRKSDEYINYAKNRTIADRFSHFLNFNLEKIFVYPSKKELGFQLILNGAINWDRKNTEVRVPPQVSRQLTFMDAERRAKLPEIVFHSPSFLFQLQKKLIQGMNLDEIVNEQQLKIILERTRKSVQILQKRGVKIAFLRMPSTKEYLKREKTHLSREKFWDALIHSSGAPGIHFEDYESLRNFDCIDYSHLKSTDATLFTEHLLEILQQKKLLDL